MPKGTTATDLVLTITEILRKHGVVGTFVEFYGEGLSSLTIADRATLGNMCPEYGATVAIFPIDDMTLDYLSLTGRDAAQVALVEQYAKAQGLFRTDGAPDAVYSEVVESRSQLGGTEPGGPEAPAGSGLAVEGQRPRFSRRSRRCRFRRRAARGGGPPPRSRPWRLLIPPWTFSITARSSSRPSRAAPTRRIPAS